MALTANKGEWSELYVLFKLLGDTILYAGDINHNRIEDLFYPISQILRSEKQKLKIYNVNKESIEITEQDGDLTISIPKSLFITQANNLLYSIKEGSKTFSIPDIEAFMAEINCQSIKAQSSDKSDIKIRIHDLRTGMNPLLGFSIKSHQGSSSTLLNPSRATNVIYTITDSSLCSSDIERINNIESKSKIRSRINEITNHGCSIDFSKLESSTMFNNLTMIDSALPLICSSMLLYYYKEGICNIKDLIQKLNTDNPLKYDLTSGHPFYEYKIKRLLVDIALGMTPARVWTGKYDATGGYLVVKEDGEILCYHIYDKNQFENYLVENTKLDTPSSSRYGFGVIIEENPPMIKLNMQIRFK